MALIQGPSTSYQDLIMNGKKLSVLLFAFCFLFGSASLAMAAKGTVSYDFEIKDFVKGKPAALWIPYPMSDGNQDITQVAVSGNFDRQAVYRDAKTGAIYLHADWQKPEQTPVLSMSFHVDSHYSKGAALKDGGNAFPPEVLPYLASSKFIPSDDARIQAFAKEATAGKKTVLEKARGVYDWTIKNTFRDPDVKGCGLGQALTTMTQAKGGGKCADISSVFVAVARAAGVPARDVFGLRGSGKSGEMTGDFHCWTEFYLPGTGWVMADPADVRKAMLVEKLELGDKATAERTEFFWNGDDLFRIALSRADRGVVFSPAQKDGPVEYFMYPYAEVDGKALDYRAPKSFVYTVNYKAE